MPLQVFQTRFYIFINLLIIFTIETDLKYCRWRLLVPFPEIQYLSVAVGLFERTTELTNGAAADDDHFV